MNINKYLQSLGIVFPKKCDYQTLKYYSELESIPVFLFYDKDHSKWIVDYIYHDIIRYKRTRNNHMRPLDITTLKQFLRITESFSEYFNDFKFRELLQMIIWDINDEY